MKAAKQDGFVSTPWTLHDVFFWRFSTNHDCTLRGLHDSCYLAVCRWLATLSSATPFILPTSENVYLSILDDSGDTFFLGRSHGAMVEYDGLSLGEGGVNIVPHQAEKDWSNLLSTFLVYLLLPLHPFVFRNWHKLPHMD